ncbi:MAG TPA: molecular chaperone HtpG [Polyangiaceae bacterium]|nr:molecular chaperone HtpG [Polyangiaceae bacterium]
METVRHPFQAEVSQVLNLVIHSLYSNKEIFLRELVSNASDALDKRRFAALKDPSLLEEGEVLKIRLSADLDAGTLTIWDNGIGMSEAELAKNLGTIAWSGSREFINRMKGEGAPAQDLPTLIGQFGVGFYSAYLVADRVTVTSRAAGSAQAYSWESTGEEGFSISEAQRDSVGTSIVLHLKAEQREYLEPYRLRELVLRYSDYVQHPIELVGSNDPKKEAEVETINRGSALWQRSPKEVTHEQYVEFYKHQSHDFEPPLGYRHFQIEGTQMFTALLFVPGRAPFDLFDPEASHGVRLHVRRVFVMDNCQELLPRWLRFVRGVVDSEDLPLNVSRETLQDSRAVKAIKKQIVAKTLELLGEIAEQRPDDYDKFWSTFGVVLKEGLYFEPEQKDKLAKLLRFESHAQGKSISLDAYVANMKSDQPAIYYVLGPNQKVASSSPHLESARSRGYDVLLLTDPVDSFAISALEKYGDKPLVSVTGADWKLPEGEQAGEKKPDEEANASVLKGFLEVLKDRVLDVKASSRLTDSPACLVQAEGGLPPHLERLFKAQKRDLPASRRILELNLNHPLVKSVTALNARESSSPRVKEWLELIYDQALLAEGSPIEDPAAFAKKLTRLFSEAAAHELGQPS